MLKFELGMGLSEQYTEYALFFRRWRDIRDTGVHKVWCDAHQGHLRLMWCLWCDAHQCIDLSFNVQSSTHQNQIIFSKNIWECPLQLLCYGINWLIGTKDTGLARIQKLCTLHSEVHCMLYHGCRICFFFLEKVAKPLSLLMVSKSPHSEVESCTLTRW